MRTAIVVTTYNNPRALGLTLAGFAQQSDSHFSLFIADDGSGAETKAKIDSYRSSLRHPLHHEWHPDEGYRKSLINNKVFALLGDYQLVILADGDTIPHYRFVEDHKFAHLKRGAELFMGRRIDLGPWLSGQISEQMIGDFQQGPSLLLLQSWLRGETHNLSRSLRICVPWLQKLLRRDRVPDLLGSNFSVRRELLWRVNGYDEDFRGYWGEDGDLFVRLRNSGARILGLKSFAIQFHLDHKRLEPTPENLERYRSILRLKDYCRCPRGIVKD